MVNISVTMDDLPRHLRGYADQIPFALAGALTSVAFDAKKKMPDIMGEDLTLRNNYTAGTSIRVEKATKTNLESAVGSVAWYTELQAEGGVKEPREGILYNGRKYLIIPGPDRRNAKGRLKKAPKTLASKPFVLETKEGQLLYVARRRSRGKSSLFVFGALELESRYQERLKWRSRVDDYVIERFPVRFAEAMERAARTARRRV